MRKQSPIWFKILGGRHVGEAARSLARIRAPENLRCRAASKTVDDRSGGSALAANPKLADGPGASAPGACADLGLDRDGWRHGDQPYT